MGWISGNGNVAFKLTSSAIWLVYTWESCVWPKSKNSDWNCGRSAFFGFREPTGSPENQNAEFTRGLSYAIRKASYGADFNGKLSLRLSRRFLHARNGEFPISQTVFSWPIIERANGGSLVWDQ